MSVVETLLSNPVVTSALAALFLVLVYVLRGVPLWLARALEHFRRPLWQWLHPLFARFDRPLLRDKTGSDDAIATCDTSVRAVARALWRADYRWNPLSTKKYRRTTGSRQWTALSLVYRETLRAEQQHHVYLFGGSGEVDVYGHREASVTDPGDHEGGDEMVSGDPAGRVRDALADADIPHTDSGESAGG